ncbi:hypothetical protein ACEPAI_8900 [Sanghuangporus weigelae]
MASINIDPPLSTPAHEWAADTTNALQRQNTSSVDAGPISGTGTSTPGSEFPGAFPGGLQTHSQSKSEQAEERTPRAAVTHLADAAPPKSTSGFQETAKGYIPYVDVQRALNTAKAYLPESVVGAVGSVLPAGMTNSQPEKNIDPISGAKPASVGSSGSGPESIDNASTTVIPPSTRTGSLTSSMTGDRTPPGDGHNRDLGNALDTTSQAKPNVPTSSLSDIPITSTSPASTAPVPGASSKSTTSPVNAANTAVAMHALPTPPTSDVSSSSNAHADKKEHGGTGRTSATKSGLKDDDSYPQPNDGSRIAKPSQSGFENDGPTPPLKDETSRSVDKSEPSQPKVNVAPGQKHVKSGTAVGARLPGTAPVGGEGAPPSFSPKSEISNPRVQEDDEKDPSREQKFGGSNLNASISSSDDSFEANGNGNGKKEGRVKKAVHKVKDKLSHRSH